MTQILFIDDDVDIGRPNAKYLISEGFEAAAIADGRDAAGLVLSGRLLEEVRRPSPTAPAGSRRHRGGRMGPARRRGHAIMAVMPAAIVAAPAQAHVKWFCGPIDLAQPPIAVAALLSPLFLWCLLAFAAMIATGTALDTMASRRLPDGTAKAARRRLLADTILRIGMAVYLTCMSRNLAIVPWADRDSVSLLVPDIYGSGATIAPLQLVVAACLLIRRLSLVAAIGLIGLFAMGLAQRGAFYMIDYVFFLGIAVFVMAGDPALRRFPRLARYRESAVVATMSISLMWASLDKFLYPQWTIAILLNHPQLALGYRFDTVATIGGFVEFSLAFYLLVGNDLLGRVAALLLIAVMSTATLEFGMLDVIGHISVVTTLIMIALVGQVRLQPAVRGASPAAMAIAARTSAIFVATLAGLCGAFYILHALSLRF